MSKRKIGATVSGIEVRKAATGAVGIRGYAAVFDQPENGEVIKPGAFTRSLQHGGDVKLLLGHEGLPLASTRAGTMSIGEDEHGLWVDVESLDMSNPRAAELASILERGDVSDMSFGFIPVRESRAADGTREILEARVIECSVVTWGWYSGTEISLKSLAPVLAELRTGRVPSAVADELRRMIEGRATEGSFDAIREQVADAICDRLESLGGACYVWIADIGPDWAVYESGSDYYRVSYSIDDAGVVTLGDASEVSRVVQWVPVAPEVETASAPAFRRLEMARALA